MSGRHALLVNSALGLQAENGDQGPLLLAAVQGIEGLSMPYSFDLTLYRRPEHGDIDPRVMINSRAAFAILAEDKYIWRSGVIETFSKTGDNDVAHGGAKTMLSFQAHFIPAIKMLDHERVFRVFEGRTMVQILHEVMQDFPNIEFGPYLDTRGLDPDSLSTTIDYVVQFNETSFAFLTRLLNQCGVGYHFDHTNASRKSGHSETLVLHGTTPAFPSVSSADMNIKTGAPEDNAISGFRYTYQPAHKLVTTGDFNTLKPEDPFRGHAAVDVDHDVLKGQLALDSRFNTEGFPTTAPQLSKDGDKDNVNGDAQSAIQDEESGAIAVAGQSKNRTFMAGQTFHIDKDFTQRSQIKTKLDFGVPKDDRYLLTIVTISAFDRDYGNNLGNDILTFINPARWWSRATAGKDSPGIDLTSATASGTLQNWFQDEGKGALDKAHSSPIYLLKSMGSTGLGLTSNLLGIVGDSIKELINNHADDYSNIFSAVPWDRGRFARLPLPTFTASVANGPHLAVVVGRDGIDTAAGTVYSDVLGRVRVRFPWHRKLGGLGPSPGEQDPYKTGRNTAWIRVSEGWASQGFGTQFLPRIGDEVVVSFLDGDPARPLITGRVYNANGGPPNLPFPAKGTQPGTLKPNYVHDPKEANGGAAPNGNILRSGIKTRSTPAKDAKDAKNHFHLLRFDDLYGKEQLLLRSQARLDVTALTTKYQTIGGNYNLTVGGIDVEKEVASGDIVQKNFGNYMLHVGDSTGPFDGGNRWEKTEADYELEIAKEHRLKVDGTSTRNVGGNDLLHVGAPGGTGDGGNRYEKVEKKYDLHVVGNHQIKSDGNIVSEASTISLSATEIILEAKTKISLKVGGAFIVIMPAGVHANGPMVTDNSAGSADPAIAVNLFSGSLDVGMLAPIADPAPADPGTS